jgi:cytoskeletal protein RodZ
LDAGLTLFRIGDGTKIPFWILESIERDDFSRIPGGIFIRGYLDAFARAVRLDPHEILTAHFGERPTPIPPHSEWQPTGTPLWQTAIIAVAIITLGVMWANAARSNSDARSGPAASITRVAQPKRPAPKPKAAVPTGAVSYATDGQPSRAPAATGVARAPVIPATGHQALLAAGAQ